MQFVVDIDKMAQQNGFFFSYNLQMLQFLEIMQKNKGAFISFGYWIWARLHIQRPQTLVVMEVKITKSQPTRHVHLES